MMMDMYSFRILRCQPLRLTLSVGGIAFCVLLMLFLLSVYHGVADGSLEYIRQNKVDLWVLQRNASNIMRCTSVLFSQQGEIIESIPGVRSASPVLLLLATIKSKRRIATVYLAGFDPAAGIGGPPHLVEGRSVLTDNDIVLDRSFADKYGFGVGDSVEIQNHQLEVIGISTGTNAFVIQYAFVSLRRAQIFLNFPGIVTCYLVTVAGDQTVTEVAEAIRRALPTVEVYEHETFVTNNTREMQAGFLPFIYTVTSIGVIVLTAILSLLLSISILERRKDFAIMKTLGSPSGFLACLIIEQSLLISGAGIAVALALFYPTVAIIKILTPEIAVRMSVQQAAAVMLAVGIISLISSFISMQRLRRIYSLEAFS